jgi:aspartate racemase
VTPRAAVPRLGLIGGLGPAATVFYYDGLLRAHAERSSSPRLLVSHADQHAVLRALSRGELPRLTNYLARLANDLAKAGADVVAIAAITPHVCGPQLLDALRVPFVDATEAIGEAVQRRRLTRVAVFGSKFTMESSLFGRLGGVDLAQPTVREAKSIQSIYVRTEARQASSDDVDELGRIAHRLCTEDRADAVILAGTAFSLISHALRPDVRFVDCGRVHLDAIMNALLKK